MQARVVPAARGWAWVVEGFRMFRVAPLAWLALVFAYWMAMTVISLVPYVGVAVASILVPAFSVGFMAASRAAQHRTSPALSMLGAGFRDHLPAQLALGGVYFAALVVLLAASALADDGTLTRWMATGEKPSPEALGSDEFLSALMLFAALYAPVMMAFWFAPLLVAWHGLSAAKALFFSFFASLMNWRAFVVYGTGTALVLFILPSLLVLGAMFVTGGTTRIALLSVLFPFLLTLLPTLFASFYASYRDVFDARSVPPAEVAA